ncbi:MAG: thioredoxin family protein [Crocinitomicaceae bacterium]|jgi:thioredoxin 1|nr:thioredoxin family protein [Crocinitomicaceae bacterium]
MKNDKNGVVQSESKTIEMLDFYLPIGCPACRTLEKFFDELTFKYGNLDRVQKIDVLENKELCDKYRILNAPTMIFLRDGEVIERIVGFDNTLKTKSQIEMLIFHS